MVRARQIEQKGLARIGDEADAAPMPIDIGERHSVYRFGLRPLPAGMDSDGPAHASVCGHCEEAAGDEAIWSGQTPLARDCFAARAVTKAKAMLIGSIEKIALRQR
jgi:hypothetical protein